MQQRSPCFTCCEQRHPFVEPFLHLSQACHGISSVLTQTTEEKGVSHTEIEQETKAGVSDLQVGADDARAAAGIVLLPAFGLAAAAAAAATAASTTAATTAAATATATAATAHHVGPRVLLLLLLAAARWDAAAGVVRLVVPAPANT
jgi:hypothetical protein